MSAFPGSFITGAVTNKVSSNQKTTALHQLAVSVIWPTEQTILDHAIFKSVLKHANLTVAIGSRIQNRGTTELLTPMLINNLGDRRIFQGSTISSKSNGSPW